MISPGDVIDNATLCDLFRVAYSGGMRRSLAMNHLVLIADWTMTGVRNRWEGDVLHYVGQGAGDQALTRNNRALARSPVTGEAVHLFEAHRRGLYAYRGRVELAGEPYQETQPDAAGEERTAWVFPLRLSAKPAADLAAGAARPSAPTAHLPAGAFAVVRNVDAGNAAAVQELLDRIRNAGAEVLDRRDVDEARYQRSLGRWHDEVMAELRRAARRRVAELRDRRRRHGDRWGFAADEVEINDGADDDRVRHVLEITGIGDEFARLRDEAYASAPQPEPPREEYVDVEIEVPRARRHK